MNNTIIYNGMISSFKYNISKSKRDHDMWTPLLHPPHSLEHYGGTNDMFFLLNNTDHTIQHKQKKIQELHWQKESYFKLNQPLPPAAAEQDIVLFFLSENKKGRELEKMLIRKKKMHRSQIARKKSITHSSITSPSPTIRGPVSSGAFLCASSAASASASCLFSFSICFKKVYCNLHHKSSTSPW